MAAHPADPERSCKQKGLVKVAEGKILVTGLKGPLQEGWQKQVEALASQIPTCPNAPADGHARGNCSFDTVHAGSTQGYSETC